MFYSIKCHYDNRSVIYYLNFQCYFNHHDNLMSSKYTNHFCVVVIYEFHAHSCILTKDKDSWLPPYPKHCHCLGWFHIQVHKISNALPYLLISFLLHWQWLIPPFNFHSHIHNLSPTMILSPFISKIYSPHTDPNHPSFQLLNSLIIPISAILFQRNFLTSFILISSQSIDNACMHSFFLSNIGSTISQTNYLPISLTSRYTHSFLKMPGFHLPHCLFAHY